MTLPSTLKDLMPRLWGKRDAPRAGDLVREGENQDPFLSLQREVNRAFTNFWRAAEPTPLGGFGLPREAAADVVETDRAIEVSVELPGLEEKDVEVSIAGGLLTVKAEKKSEREDQQGGWHLAERSYGLIRRSLMLPPGADADHAEAKFRNGVLTVTVPKTALPADEARRITVRQG